MSVLPLIPFRHLQFFARNIAQANELKIKAKAAAALLRMQMNENENKNENLKKLKKWWENKQASRRQLKKSLKF